jgi:hypothetical protein
VLEAQGRAPNLSPTGRFLAAYQGGRDGRMLELFDLESGARIGSVMGPALIWHNGDSVLISGAEQYERVLVLQTLVDDVTPPMREKNEFGVEELCERGFATTCRPPARLLADHEGCNGCGAAWLEVTAALSVDTGIAARWHREDAGNRWKRTVYSLGASTAVLPLFSIPSRAKELGSKSGSTGCSAGSLWRRIMAKNGPTFFKDGLSVNYLTAALRPSATTPASPTPLQKGLTVNHLTTALGTTGQSAGQGGSSSGAQGSSQGGSDKK